MFNKIAYRNESNSMLDKQMNKTKQNNRAASWRPHNLKVFEKKKPVNSQTGIQQEIANVCYRYSIDKF